MIPDWPTFWTATSSVGQVVSTILAVAALIYSIRTFNRSMSVTHYGALDQRYTELLTLAIDRPHLRNPNATRTPEQQLEYEAYAHLAWCFVEGVYDYSRANKDLLRTWHSAVEIETRLHRSWLDRPENRYMFKPDFHDYIATTFPQTQAPQVLRAPTENTA